MIELTSKQKHNIMNRFKKAIAICPEINCLFDEISYEIDWTLKDKLGKLFWLSPIYFKYDNNGKIIKEINKD